MQVSADQLADAVDGTVRWASMPPRDGGETIVGRSVIDSREIETGDLFWGLPGRNHHGSDFAHEAFMRGATGVVSDRPVEPLPGGFAVVVANTQLALWQLARWHREHLTGAVVAVTGSVGKTTTRQMIDHVLAAGFRGTASRRNHNNQIGVPLSVLNADCRDDYVVLELGASARGEIDALARLCEPQIGVITCIGDAHLEGFGSREAIAAAKAELLPTLEPGGCAVLCGDDPLIRRMAPKCAAEITWFGRNIDNDVIATHVEHRDGRLRFRVDDRQFSLPVWGRHHLVAALAAVCVGRLFGRQLSEIADALADFCAVPMRCQVAQIGPVTVINDAYNASPISMKAALALLQEFGTSGRRIVVSGDMQELGDATEDLHYSLGGQIVTTCGADRLIACGRQSDAVARGARDAGMPADYITACVDHETAVEHLKKTLRPGDIVLAKGSRVMEMERVVATLFETMNSQVA